MHNTHVGSEKRLRDYQQRAVDHVLSAWSAEPARRIVLAMPTGAGKTETAAAILTRFRAPLAIVHTRVLLDQTRRRLAHIPGLRVATVQSLLPTANAEERFREAASADVVWFDECHHIAADEWGDVAARFAGRSILGTSATPTTDLSGAFDELFAPVGYQRLIADGHLVPCDVLQAAPVGKREQADSVSEYLGAGRREDGSWRPAIYTALTVVKCEAAASRLRDAGVRSEVIHAGTRRQERDAHFARYAAGDLDALCSPMVLAEGFDSPRAEVLIADRGFSELVTYLQYVGRVLRPCAGKTRALYIDTSGAVRRHGMPTDDRAYSLALGTTRGKAPAPEEPQEYRAPTARELVEARYSLIRDTLADRLNALQEQASDRGYKSGFVFHKFLEQTGLKLPRIYEAKYRSVCITCRHRVELNAPMFWNGPRSVQHVDCWLQSLSNEALDGAAEKGKIEA